MSKDSKKIFNYPEGKSSIKTWNEDDRPREKLVLRGKRNLSNAELLAIILGSGNRGESAVQLAQRILASVNNSWSKLAQLTLGQLMQFKGVGEAKAISVITALEIGNRRRSEPEKRNPKLDNAQMAYQLVQPIFMDLAHEELWVIYLNRANREIQKVLISKGGFTATTVDVRLVLKRALELNALALILAHNHPSGNLNPSTSDLNLTQSIVNAAGILNIQVIDHIICSNHGFYSFCEEGKL